MSTYIIKLSKDKIDYFLEWSTVVDAPVTQGMKLNDFIEYYKAKYGSDGINSIDERLARVNQKGTSSYTESLSDLINNNKAGKHEKKLTKDQLIEEYCLNDRKRNK